MFFTAISPTTTPAASDLLVLLGNQIQLVGIIATIFLSCIPIIFIIIGILLWSNNQQRTEAEKNNKAIKLMYDEISSMTIRSKTLLDDLEKNLVVAQKKAGEIESTVNGIKSASSEVNTMKHQIAELQGNLGSSLVSLSNVQGTIPSFEYANQLGTIDSFLNDPTQSYIHPELFRSAVEVKSLDQLRSKHKNVFRATADLDKVSKK